MSVLIGQLLALASRFGIISLFAVGGGVSTLIPLLHDLCVNREHWVDDRQFAEAIAISQATPGPNFMLIPIVGWHVAGWIGGLVSLIAFLAIPVTSAFVVGRILQRHENVFIVLLRRCFRAVTAGLWIAGGIAIARTADHGTVTLIVTAVVVIVSLLLELNPLWWCLGAGIVGALFA
jgi:chromate transporter